MKKLSDIKVGDLCEHSVFGFVQIVEIREKTILVYTNTFQYRLCVSFQLGERVMMSRFIRKMS